MSVVVSTSTVFPLLADGGFDGTVSLPYIVNLAVGVSVTVSATGQPDKGCKVQNIQGLKVTLSNPDGSKADLSAYTRANGAFMTMPAQTVAGVSTLPTLGAAGSQGAQGQRGAQGNTGAQGAQGAQGT